MTRNEIMYDYAKTEYSNSVNRKNELRNRAATFFGIGFTIISAVATISFSISENCFSIGKIVLLIISAIFLLTSLILFLLIYTPSNQLTHSPFNVINDLRNIEDAEENKELVKYYQQRDEFRYIVSELSLAYTSERMTEVSRWYDQKVKLFMKYFIIMSLAMIISLILLVVTIAI